MVDIRKLIPRWFNPLLDKIIIEHPEELSIKGEARLTVTDPKTGRIIKVIKSKNLIVTVGKQFIGDMLIDKDAGHDIGLTYQALGTNDTAPATGQTTLVAEAKRKAITSKSCSGTVMTLSTFFTASESDIFVKEAGVFGHASATVTLNTGKMLSRWLVSYDNSAGNYDLTFDWVLTIS